MLKRLTLPLVFIAFTANCGSGSSQGTGGSGGHGTGGSGGKAAGGSAAGGAGVGGKAGGDGVGGSLGGAGGTAVGGAPGGAAGAVGGAGGKAGAGGAPGGASGGLGGGKGGAAGGAGGGSAGKGGAGGGAAGGAGGSAAGGAGGSQQTQNLIVNGNAEAAVGSTNGTAVATPGWIVTGDATALKYGASGGYPIATDPGPADRATNLFAGGNNDATSSMTQSISLASYAAKIDTSSVAFTLSGYLGGYLSQGDGVVVTATFHASTDGTGAPLGTATSIGPVTAAERQNITGLLQRGAPGNVPVGARSVTISVTMTRVEGSANDGYADDLSFVLIVLN
jgi:hypothetical protein